MGPHTGHPLERGQVSKRFRRELVDDHEPWSVLSVLALVADRDEVLTGRP
jgi:hypothetical protein